MIEKMTFKLFDGRLWALENILTFYEHVVDAKNKTIKRKLFDSFVKAPKRCRHCYK